MAMADVNLGTKLRQLETKYKTSVKSSYNRNKRKSKNLPIETSAKNPTAGFIFNATSSSSSTRKKGFDPRFESLCGQCEIYKFRNAYAFLKEWIDKEKGEIEGHVQKAPGEYEANQHKQALQQLKKMQRHLFDDTKKDKKSIINRTTGKRVFISKKKLNKQKLQEKYQQLKQSGKLTSFIEKRRKRQAAKDRRLLPAKRS